MGLHDAMFLPSRASSTPYFLKMFVDVKTSVPHAFEVRFGVSKGMLPV